MTVLLETSEEELLGFGKDARCPPWHQVGRETNERPPRTMGCSQDSTVLSSLLSLFRFVIKISGREELTF